MASRGARGAVVGARRRLMSNAALDRHRALLAACRRCAGTDAVVRPIVSLARRPRVMLVGQAPGKVEMSGGKPFAGRAGRTLFRWLAEAGVDEDTARDRIYIAAITRCFPGAHPSGRGDRVPSRAERDACAAWLDAELALLKPPLVIPVGKLAIERFLGAQPLEAIIGRAHEVQIGDRITEVIPLPHPSGASSWIHEGNHPQLLTRAIGLLGARFATLGIAPPPV